MNPTAKAWLTTTAASARRAGHVFPEMAACEAALESGYGSSQLAREDFNLFGTKQHVHPVYGTASLPTKEFLHGDWVVVNALWVKYPSFDASFTDRMNTLRNMEHAYAHYFAALSANDPSIYIVEVSKSWATDPKRAQKVQAIYDEYFGTQA